MLHLSPAAHHNSLFRDVIITGIHEEVPEARTFTLKPERGELAYQAGQFLTFVFSTQSGLARRSYSFSSSPECKEPTAVTIKRMPNGLFSRPLFEGAEPGDKLTIAGGASGFFVLPPNLTDYERIFFLAAGSGITPVYSMIKSLLAGATQVPSILIYSNSSPDKTIFREKIERLERHHPDSLKVEWLFSNHHDLWRARLNKMNLENLLKKYMGQPARTLVYLCGPFDYMRMATIVLQSEGIPQDNIRREIFTPSIPVSPERPPDVLPHQVTVHMGGTAHLLKVQFPDSILATAKKQGVELPYSCEAGRCGSCVASCTSGRIWMKFNEVLTDREVNDGRVLLCNGFPFGGDAVVRID